MVSNGFFDISCCYLATPFHRKYRASNLCILVVLVWVCGFLLLLRFLCMYCATFRAFSSISNQNGANVCVCIHTVWWWCCCCFCCCFAAAAAAAAELSTNIEDECVWVVGWFWACDGMCHVCVLFLIDGTAIWFGCTLPFWGLTFVSLSSSFGLTSTHWLSPQSLRRCACECVFVNMCASTA